MSNDFRLRRRIFAGDLFDGRLAKFGVHEWVAPKQYQAPNEFQEDDFELLFPSQIYQTRALTDGRGYLWVYIDDEGYVLEFTSRNDTDAILAAVAEAFETEIFSEEEPQFWGFETNEELFEHIREVSLARGKAQPREA